MNIPDDLRYTADHAWIRPAGLGVWVVGITDFAQDQLGEIEFVDFPAEGARFATGEFMMEVESQKTFGEVYAPFACTVVSLNAALRADPNLVNEDPYGAGWLVEVESADATPTESLLDAAGYREAIV